MGLFLLKDDHFQEILGQLTNTQAVSVGLLEELITPIAESKGAYIIEIAIRGERTGKVVEVFLDSDGGISTETCAAISRELSGILDVKNIIPGKFHLVVSSPGIDRPLKYPRQYAKHVGRLLKIACRIDDAKTVIEGKLVNVGEAGIELTTKDNSVVGIRFETIIESKVIPLW